MNPLKTRLKNLIRQSGPISVSMFMEMAIHHYYSTRDPFGAKGDFTTAPEISQMFGEMVGVFLADAWIKMGRPAPVMLVECGPGRGTLMADILRATRNVEGFHQAVRIHLIEISPALREKQKQALRDYAVEWHDDLSGVPDGPMLFIANEFLDALPARQYQIDEDGWHERFIGLDKNGDLIFGLGPVTAPLMEGGAPGNIFEQSPARESFIAGLAERVARNRGIALIIDYGHDRAGFADTLQAVSNHRYMDVLLSPGEADLTSHVDFSALKAVAEPHVVVHGPVGQGDFLKRLGIEIRAARLNQPGELTRLTANDQMGNLFRVMVLCGDPAMEIVL
jgi:NADH dehydrogenase [ubiquinone] 1 alpha subcomplex assembly factor 7